MINDLSFYLTLFPSTLMILILLFYSISNKKTKSSNYNYGFLEIDYIARNSLLSEISPIIKCLFSLSLLLMSIILDNFKINILISILCCFIIVIFGKITFKNYLKLLLIPIVFLITSSIVILLNFSYVIPSNSYFYLKFFNFYIYTNRRSIILIETIVVRSFAALSSLYLLILSTPAEELFYLLEKIHCPSVIIELMNMIYRFIFLMIEAVSEMSNAAKSRLGYLTYKKSLITFGKVASNLLLVSVKKVNDYWNALEARLYTGHLNFIGRKKSISISILFLAIFIISYLLLIYFL